MSTTSVIAHAGLSDVGRVRQENEDHWFADPKMGLYLVADGMGGALAGGLASKAVAEVLPRLLRQKLEDIRRLDDPAATRQVLAALREMSNRLRKESRGKPSIDGLGSTVVLALVAQQQALVAHLGDSRAYLLHDRRLEQLTKDHSICQLLVDCGEITPEEARSHPARGQLTRFVGMCDGPLPEANAVELAPGDRLLLCSDGLSGMLGHDQLTDILNRQPGPLEACNALVAAANEAGGKDNITVVVVSVSRGDLSSLL
jgi:PPM family protein phosphatase